MPKSMVTIRGRQHEWCVPTNISQASIDDMRADGVEVIVPQNIIPSWIAALGMTRAWCFCQDVWHLKNPLN